ncbi:T-cell activation Rho GTPase-activating protein [Amblyraja radiata]|uniref:T-cell activation Rho GTPase-activating protein n=1 Tax=Amblyraja radiata TaxID=386614 RepID=UPI0014036E03|nr:T-cell activation Rho GTPase-activating protein [Amblyraja radiata]
MKVLSNSVLSKTLTVSNMEPPGEVIKTLLTEPAELRDTENLQLVLSNSKNLASSLIDHQCTFSTKTNQLRKEQAKCDLSSGNMERKPFKPSEKSCCQVQHSQDARLKHCKKNKPKGTWPFRKNSARSESHSSKNDGLFDRPLKDVCDHKDVLSKPILDILTVLLQKGPSSVGIFRKSANVKTCKELIEKLNTGKEVFLEEEPVNQLAAVFKNFLRRIPNSVLATELYDSWMVAMEKVPSEERIAEIKQLLAKLPTHNCLLLRYVFCLLHYINKHSEVNRMDAYNLAICIGPNMLWPNKPPLDALQKEVTAKVVSLTQFLIENCCSIFGNETTTLLGEPAQGLSENTDNLDMSPSHQNDSAYDSTDQDDWKEGENEKWQRANSSSCRLSMSQEMLRMARRQDCQTDVTARATASCSNESIDGRATFGPNVTAHPSGLATGQRTMRVNRRSSEPTLAVAFNPRKINGQGLLARSHDDCSVPFDVDFNQHQMNKQVSEESFTRHVIHTRPGNFNVSSHSELSTASSSKASSVSSLASSCSNMSENSVFICSPLVSPTCCQENYVFPDHSTKLQTNAMPDSNSYVKSTKERAKKPLTKTYSWGPSRTLHTNQESFKDNTLREKVPTCQTVPEAQVEDSGTARFRARFMSVDEVFQQVDSKKRRSPPSYTQAIEESYPSIPSTKQMTVRNMKSQLQRKEHMRFGGKLVAGQRDRPCSLTDELLYPSHEHQLDLDSCDEQTTVFYQSQALHNCSEHIVHLTRPEKAQCYRGRAMSESAGRSTHQMWSTQAFVGYKDFQHAKESYV